MSNKKLSPRQKMISMMYLVLTALLAMNVSKEVLNAFVVVNQGIENSNQLVLTKNNNLYKLMTKELSKNENEKSLKIQELVQKTQKLTSESISYIDIIKAEILNSSGINDDSESKVLFANLDDLETGTRILTVSNKGEKSKGEFLREELEQIYNKYLDIIEEGNPTEKNTVAFTDYRSLYAKTLSLQIPNKNVLSVEGKSISWVNKNFFNVPVIATDVILTKIQNDIYSTEAEVLDYLFKQIGADVLSFNELSAEVISPKSYLPAGKIFEANIFIAASSSEQVSEVFIGKLDKSRFETDENSKIIKTFVLDDKLFFKGDFKKVPITNGKAKFEQLTSGVGLKSYEGIIRVKKPTGGYDLYPFEFDYEVAPKSGFSVSPTKMNVLYIGIDNPLSITVSGSKDTDVSAKISDGLVLRKNGKWVAQVKHQGKANIEVFGIIDGERKKIGTQEFRVKRIPNPIATLDGVEYDNSISKARLKQHNSVMAVLKNFQFDIHYKVKSYDFLLKHGTEVTSKRGINSGKFVPKVKSLIKKATSNDMVFFQNIYVVGPDGQKRKIPAITLTVK